MSADDSQLVVPPSFVALFVDPGRTRPSLSREDLLARHEHCEDLANLLAEHAQNQHWDLGLTEADVLERIHRGLLCGASALPPPQAGWVIGRLAELLGWPPPDWATPGSATPAGR